MGVKVNPDRNTSPNVTRKRKGKAIAGDDSDDGKEGDDEATSKNKECEDKDSLKKHTIYQVQAILDENNVLIEEVNRNQASKDHAKMTKNVELINKINSNLAKVQSLYSDMSANFTTNFTKLRDSRANVDKTKNPVDDSVKRS